MIALDKYNKTTNSEEYAPIDVLVELFFNMAPYQSVTSDASTRAVVKLYTCGERAPHATKHNKCTCRVRFVHSLTQLATTTK